MTKYEDFKFPKLVEMALQLFKGYDVRGIYGSELDEPLMERIGAAFSTFFPTGTDVLFGHDPRPSSIPLSQAFLKGATDGGLDATNLGMVPTPLILYALAHRKSAGGAMVTASHNPPQYNGVKLYSHDIPFPSWRMQAMGEMVEGGKKFPNARKKGAVRNLDLNPEYANAVVLKSHPSRKLEAVLDAGNGACGIAAPLAYEKLCGLTRLYCEPDGTFPNHLADPHREETLATLKKTVMEKKADLGIALDGDGDRVAFVDELGRKVRSDDAIVIFARHYLKLRRGASVAFDLRCSNIVREEIVANGGKAVMTKAGRTNVIAAVMQHNAVLGGEQTGHAFFSEMYSHDDAIFAGAKMIEIVSKSGLPLSKMVDSIKRYPSTPEIRLAVPHDRKIAVVESVKKQLSAAAAKLGATLLDIDGVRLDLPNGAWGLLRVSNTEPAITMRFEARTPKELQEVYSLFRERIASQGVKMGEKAAVG